MTERISFESAQKTALDMARTRLLVGGALIAAAFLVIGVRLVDVTVFSKSGPSRPAAREVAHARRRVEGVENVECALGIVRVVEQGL